jgi:group I intron endonuclease
MNETLQCCGVYAIENTKDGSVYIGQSVNIEQRFKTHQYQLRIGYHTNHALQRAWKEYGKSSFVFKVLEYCPESELDKREYHYIKAHLDRCYNVKDGKRQETYFKHHKYEKLLTAVLNAEVDKWTIHRVSFSNAYSIQSALYIRSQRGTFGDGIRIHTRVEKQEGNRRTLLLHISKYKIE